MANVIKSSVNLVDSAIGPLAVTEAVVENFDIDDHVHATVRSQGLKLQMILRAKRTDPRLAKNRTPVDLDGTQVGGF